ncbi:D-alanyl-D-alanine carboxypeptidase [Tamaricihabitans halophyticus]|uniref:D-alanyl-D-alanine carboxypeptidase n=1 Tax=Tamaricihabitans halophyticus TaxID=1262583 RepID=A0A4R2RBW0_9PSEU|nr:serine hydrolase domain-containing protein [Tamaricihabitans halophyticus]TCP57211.1 D-alanyl-D-alanine carboxypeptidase [Tamaricihabitans halophyticus]
MRRVSRLGTVLGVCTALLGGAVTAGANAQPGQEQPELQQALDKVVAGGVPGSYATVDGMDEWSGASGVGDLRTGTQPDAEGQFRVASVTKTVVATTVLQLAAEGEFDLDDKIANYLPGLLPYDDQPITIRQLLQHTSGVPRDIVHWEVPADLDTKRFEHFEPEELVKLATDDQPLLFPPGEGWSYSNIGYTTLGLLVEEVTGHPLAAELTKRIFAPLGLRDTFFADQFPFVPRPAARGYEQVYEGKPRTDVTTYRHSRLWASGNIVSTADDLNTFFAALLGGKLLPEAQLTEMKATVPVSDDPGAFEYGLGLMKLPSSCEGDGWWGHAGDTAGYHTMSMHTEDASRQVSTGMNQDISAPMEASQAILQDVLPAALCENPAQAREQDAPYSVPTLPYLGPNHSVN